MATLAWQETAVRINQFYRLTKPRVVSLIVFTAVIGMFLAVPGVVPLDILFFGTLGIALVAGAAAAGGGLVGRPGGAARCVGVTHAGWRRGAGSVRQRHAGVDCGNREDRRGLCVVRRADTFCAKLRCRAGYRCVMRASSTTRSLSRWGQDLR